MPESLELQLVNLHDKEINLQPDELLETPTDANASAVSNISNSSNGSINHQLPTEQQIKPKLNDFMTACQQGNIHVIKDLIETKIVEPNETFSDGITGLHWAAINNRLTVIEYLSDLIDINVFGGELNATPLHWACRNGLVDAVDLLMKKGADATLKDGQGYNGLHLAVHSSNIMLVIYILYKCCSTNQIYVDEPDTSNRTSLHWACYQGDILSVQALIKFGANVNKTDNTMFTPLHWSFMRVYKPLLTLLIELGSDIHAKNDLGKNSFDVARDMGCYKIWIKVLNEQGLYESNNWQPTTPWLSERNSKIIVFLTPYLILPLLFRFNDFSTGYVIPKLFISLVLMVAISYILKNTVVKNFVPDRSLLKSPLASGIFSGTFFWVAVTFCFDLFPQLVFKSLYLFWLNLMVAGIIVAISYSFYKSMVLNPGLVPITTDSTKIIKLIDELLEQGKFNGENFCVNSLARRPLRSKYSHYNKRLIAKFDHFCPWVFNEVGVRNHKVFMFFIYSLNIGIVLYSMLVSEFFKYGPDGYDSDNEEECFLFEDQWCGGLTNHNFIFNLTVWCWIQGVWITFLTLTQTFQIVKGLTTYELSNLSKGTDSHKKSNICLRLLGLDHFCTTIKTSVFSLLKKDTQHIQITTSEIPTDYGIKQNWLDFWVIGDIKFRNVFYIPINGEGNLNGKVVDYYTLWEYPAKSAETMA